MTDVIEVVIAKMVDAHLDYLPRGVRLAFTGDASPTEWMHALAKAALTALRDNVSEGMVEAVDDFDVVWGYYLDGRPNSPEAVFTAMLDHALTERE